MSNRPPAEPFREAEKRDPADCRRHAQRPKIPPTDDAVNISIAASAGAKPNMFTVFQQPQQKQMKDAHAGRRAPRRMRQHVTASAGKIYYAITLSIVQLFTLVKTIA